MPSRLIAVSFDLVDPDAQGAFWGALLRRDVVQGEREVLLPGDDARWRK